LPAADPNTRVGTTSRVTMPSLAVPVYLLSLGTRIHPGERRNVAAAFLTLFGFMAGHALLETARDALFLATQPASHLPWVYLAIAVLALGISQNQGRLLSRFSTQHELSAWLRFSAVVTFGFWVLVQTAGRWVPFALYTWSGVLATLIVVRFWTVLASLFTVTQAKRVFGPVGSGSVLGAIVGSAVARLLTQTLPPQWVVLSAAFAFGITSLSPRLFRTETAEPDRTPPRLGRWEWDVGEVARLVWARPYARRVAMLVLLSTVTLTLVDFVFKSTVDRGVPAENLGEFFASVYLSLNLLSLVVQLFIVSWLVRKVGVNTLQLVVPALLVLGSVGFVAIGGLVAAIVLKGIDGSLRHSMYRTGTELLFVPVPGELRARIKPLIDVVGQRGGQALASLLILLGLTVSTNESIFAVVALITAGAWVVLAHDLRGHYVDVFREVLSEDLTHTRIEFPALDMASLETLLSTLNVADDRKVVAALDLLAAQGKAKVIPALILYHPSRDVVVHALDLFLASQREDILPIVDRLVRHRDPVVRAASLRVQSVMRADKAGLRRARLDASPEVQATALAGLVAAGWLAGGEAERQLEEIVQQGSPAAKLALVRAIRDQPVSVFEQTLLNLSESDVLTVRLEVVRAMRAVRSPLFVPALVGLLPHRSLREDVHATLVALGAAALGRLGAALADSQLSHAVRRHVPAAMAAFGSGQAADSLLKALQRESDGMIRFKILRALGRLRTEHPGIPLNTSTLDQVLNQTLSGATKVMQWRRALDSLTRGHPGRQTAALRILVRLLRDKQAHAVERLFRLLNLRYDNDDFRRIHLGLLSLERDPRASSRELIEHLVVPPIRNRLLELVDDLFGFDVEGGGPEPRDVGMTFESLLCALVDSSLESVSSLAVHYIGELQLGRLGPRLVERVEFSPWHREVVEQIRRALMSSQHGVEFATE
jgi:ATP:ADP antiporter, AAA family